MAIKRGTVKITLIDNVGKFHDSILQNTLYIPTYSQNIFSVEAATRQGVCINIYPNCAGRVTKNCTKFNILKRDTLYYLNNVITYVNRVCDLEQWHYIMGHCNKNDLLRLEKVVDGMEIKNKCDFVCGPCIMGKLTNSRNKTPAIRAQSPLEFVSSDICGPISPVSIKGFNYVISFIDNYSGYMFLYFIKHKSDAVHCLERFLADVSPFGKVGNILDLVPGVMVKNSEVMVVGNIWVMNLSSCY